MGADLSCCQAAFDRDPILYLDLTETVRRGEGRILFASPTGALVAFDGYALKGEDSGFTLWAADMETLECMLPLLPPEPSFVVGHEEFYAERLRQHFRFSELSYCYQAAYLENTAPPAPDLGLDMRRLDRTYFPLIKANYHLAGDKYLHWLIDRGMLYGAFTQGEPVGFVGTHAEGTIGLLEVLPAFRRRGIGTALQSFVTGLELSRGHVPYGQIFTDNAASQALQGRLGFRLSAGRLFWATGDDVSPS